VACFQHKARLGMVEVDVGPGGRHVAGLTRLAQPLVGALLSQGAADSPPDQEKQRQC